MWQSLRLGEQVFEEAIKPTRLKKNVKVAIVEAKKAKLKEG